MKSVCQTKRLCAGEKKKKSIRESLQASFNSADNQHPASCASLSACAGSFFSTSLPFSRACLCQTSELHTKS